MAFAWNPEQYARFNRERDRPALDLMLQIPSDLQPREVWDLGCGPGEHAALFARRWPQARVHGLDSSGQMLEAARARPESVDWVKGELQAFAPERPADLIFSNAAIQWVDDHPAVFARLMGALAPGGVLAVQIPVTAGPAWRLLMEQAAGEGPWAAALVGVETVRPVAEPEDYYDWTAPHAAWVDIWSTTYLHVLQGEDPVVRWMEGTALRPYLQRLEGETRAGFLEAFRVRAAKAFPPRADGTTLFPFRRLFLAARR